MTFGLVEFLLLAGIVLLLFGGKRIPALFKGVGEGYQNLKRSMREDEVIDVTEKSKPIEESKKDESQNS